MVDRRHGVATWAMVLSCSACGQATEPATETDTDTTTTTDGAASGDTDDTSSGASGTGPTGDTSDSTDSGGADATDFADLCAQPGVLFCDDFEGGWDDGWIEDGGDVRIVDGAAVEGEGSSVLELATYEGQQSSKLIQTFSDQPELYVRFDVQYAPAYDNRGGSHGPILGGSSDPPWGLLGTAGIKPRGDDHFVLNFEPIGVVGDGGELGFYAYFVNMQADGNGDYWGNVFRSDNDPPPIIVPGQWHCAEYGLTLNTAGENDDGRAEFWVDGIHHGSFDGFQWRTDPDLAIDTFVLDSYNHFNDGAPPTSAPNLVRYDNVVLSTSPVGCLAD